MEQRLTDAESILPFFITTVTSIFPWRLVPTPVYEPSAYSVPLSFGATDEAEAAVGAAVAVGEGWGDKEDSESKALSVPWVRA